MIFDKLSIVKKVKLLQISTVLALVILNSELWFQQQKTQELHDIEMSISEVKVGMLQLRRHEKDFILRLNYQYEQLHKKEYTSIASIIQKLESKLLEQKIFPKQLVTITKYLNEYRDNFSLLVGLYQKLDLNDQSGAKNNAENTWKALISYEGISYKQRAQLINLQLLKNKFLLKRSIENSKSFTHYAENLSSIDFFSLNPLFESYITQFSILVKLRQQIGFTHEQGKEKEVRSSFHMLENELDQLLAYIKPSVVEIQKNSTILIIVISILIALFTTLLLYSLGNSIIHPIRLIVRNINSLRLGKRDIEFPHSQDELEHIYKALINFQIDLVSLDSLREKEKEYHKRLEKEKTKLENALTEINQMQSQLVQSEKLASLGSLVAGVAHEINTPLGVAVTVGSTLEENASTFINKLKAGDVRRSDLGNFEADELEGWKVFQTALKHAANLIHNFKQVAIDQTSEERRVFKLLEVVDEVLTTISHQIKNTGISYRIEVDPNCEMESYPGPLGQVITNLFNNAVKHGMDGLTEGEILISGKVVNQNVVLTVKDDGLGVSENIIANIFDPFFTTKLGQGGSGLGLSITYNIVNSVLGGNIQVKSKEESGTCFIIEIPVNSPMKEI